ncbi:hypothetical protein RIR_jg3555.t1 [Rhizophagus irregularis DAOM 181602=DAOM 197198]|nr:hypothetical protein RIR_jg3555.t1 [Rhizophagus irregularis DAOM 181602=DAOM 197198]
MVLLFPDTKADGKILFVGVGLSGALAELSGALASLLGVFFAVLASLRVSSLRVSSAGKAGCLGVSLGLGFPTPTSFGTGPFGSPFATILPTLPRFLPTAGGGIVSAGYLPFLPVIVNLVV